MAEPERREGAARDGPGATDSASVEERKLADRFDRYARHVLLFAIPMAFIAVVDLLTRWLTGDRRFAIGLLAAVGLGLWGAYSSRRFAKRLRAGDLRAQPARHARLRAFTSLAVMFAVIAGVGYLLGGWIVAVALAGGNIVVVAALTAVARRRRASAASD